MRLRGNSQLLASPEEEKRMLVCISKVHIFWRAALETDFYLPESQCWKERGPGWEPLKTNVAFWTSTYSLTIVPPPNSIQNMQEETPNSQLLSGVGKSWSVCPTLWLFKGLPEELVSAPQIWNNDRNANYWSLGAAKRKRAGRFLAAP